MNVHDLKTRDYVCYDYYHYYEYNIIKGYKVIYTNLINWLELALYVNVLVTKLFNSSYSRVETGSGHPGQLGHVLSGSSGSDPIYKISGSDPDSALNHMQ